MARDYTYQELMAMQEEATQRVREMQRRAQLTAQRAQEELDRKKSESPPISAPQEGPPQAKAAEHSAHREKRETPLPVQEEEPHASQGAVPGKRPLPLGLAEGSSDQSLLLALMLLLNGEGADELLLLALLYIMM